MKYSPHQRLVVQALRCLLIVFVLIPFSLSAQVIPSEPKSTEWKEAHPQFDIWHSDKYIEYKRDGKVVFRTVERTTNISMPSHPEDKPAKAIGHLIEFIADGKVFASVALDKADALLWTLNSGGAVHFSSGFADLTKESRFFHVCVPKFDYYEYVVISDNSIKLQPESESSHSVAKKAFIKMTEAGNLEANY